jgi:asparagine synthase (glutamine-hydrolysing)
VLAITDHATMQKSIETRVPYLDAKLVSYSRNLPANDLFKNGSKRLLKDVLLGYGGEKFTNRKKQGFGLPLDSWLRNSTKKEWWDFNQKECQLHTFVTSQTIDVLIRKHQLGKADFSQDLWRVLVLQKWLERNF